MDIWLNPSTGRAEVSGGKIRETANAVEERRQRCLIAVRTHQGEWLFDTSRGLPYLTEILVKSPNLDQIASRIRAYLGTVEGVLKVTTCTLALDRATRTLVVTMDVMTDVGATGPFQIEVTS